jgi:hypothetical protein
VSLYLIDEIRCDAMRGVKMKTYALFSSTSKESSYEVMLGCHGIFRKFQKPQAARGIHGSRRRPRVRVPSLPPISENFGSVCWFRTFPENHQSLIDENSDQPTSKGALIFKVRRIAGCASPAVLYG